MKQHTTTLLTCVPCHVACMALQGELDVTLNQFDCVMDGTEDLQVEVVDEVGQVHRLAGTIRQQRILLSIVSSAACCVVCSIMLCCMLCRRAYSRTYITARIALTSDACGMRCQYLSVCFVTCLLVCSNQCSVVTCGIQTSGSA